MLVHVKEKGFDVITHDIKNKKTLSYHVKICQVENQKNQCCTEYC